jgi:hypothetical protein
MYKKADSEMNHTAPVRGTVIGFPSNLQDSVFTEQIGKIRTSPYTRQSSAS